MRMVISSLNWLAILAAGVSYWIIGALWFSAIAGNLWSKELEKHGASIKEPTKAQLGTKLLLTLFMNIVVATGLAILIHYTNISGFIAAIKLGLVTGICFSAATVAVIYNWESRSLKLFFIDAIYPIIGIIVCAVILSLWR